MQVVIEIPEELKQTIDNGFTNQVIINKLWDATKRGTPLPKGHGRLIDADALNFNADYNEPLISKLDFDNAQTIIEKDGD